MYNRILLLFCLLMGFRSTVVAQNLFLPQSLNTLQHDAPVGFTEVLGNYYFAGTKWPLVARQASSGFCYKTDSSGNVLQTFHLTGINGQQGYSFEAVYAIGDKIYIVAAGADYNNPAALLPPFRGEWEDGYDYNRILLLRLNQNLNLEQTDTLTYGNARTDLQVLKSVLMGEKIFMAYYGMSVDSTTGFPFCRSFISSYDVQTGFTHRPLDSTYLISHISYNQNPFTDNNVITGLTVSGDQQLLLSTILHPDYQYHAEFHFLQIDTNLQLVGQVISNGYNYQINGTGMMEEYNMIWKPTTNSSYLLGPVFFAPDYSRRANYQFFSVARLDTDVNIVDIGMQTAYNASMRPYYMGGTKNSMILLRNKKHFVLAGDAYTSAGSFATDSSCMRISKFDTAQILLWDRTFKKPATKYTHTAGVHELQNGKLMVIAARTPANGTNDEELYCFIIDSTGTPLNTFSIAVNPVPGITIYPNPTTDAIRFSLPSGQATAAYRISDIQGKLLLQGKVASGIPVPVHTLPSANYVLQVQQADKTWHSGTFTKE